MVSFPMRVLVSITLLTNTLLNIDRHYYFGKVLLFLLSRDKDWSYSRRRGDTKVDISRRQVQSKYDVRIFCFLPHSNYWVIL